MDMQRFRSFAEFYPYYLGEHQHRLCRRMHFIGSALVLLLAVTGLIQRDWRFAGFALLTGYGFAWLGHLLFEKNRPATFKNPIYSFVGDWVMFGAMLRGKITF
jgi:hypothetical protein